MTYFEGVVLDPSKKEHLYVQLYKVLKDRIIHGDILADEKLPPIRLYAQRLGVNNVTIVNAYKLLEQHGFIYKKVGSGTFVMNQRELEEVSSVATPALEWLNNDLPGQVELSQGVNMASTTPSDYLFPVDAFKEAINQVLDRDKGGAFGYQDTKGYLPLRESLTRELKQQYDIDTHVDALQILSGAQQGLDVISKALVQYGDAVIVEAPTYTGAIATFRSRGAKILELPLEADGPNMMKLREFIYQYRPKLIYVMPNYQNPTGVVYSKEKRHELLALAKKHHLYIVEDDYCSELAYLDAPQRPLKSEDENDLVVYIKSFSKALMPGLRLGVMLTPEPINRQVNMAKQSTDITTSGLTQRAFDSFIRNGDLDKQRRMMYEVFLKRHREARLGIEKYLHGLCVWHGNTGGLHFWLQIASGMPGKTLYQMLKQRGVLIANGDAFFASRTDTPYFRLTIASVETEDLIYGIRVIADILKAQDIEQIQQSKASHALQMLL
mgnify:CR=1 FL=1